MTMHAHFTVAGQKLPVSHFSLIQAEASQTPYSGFTLLESLIALFMLSLLSVTLMKHQVFLVQTQKAIEAKHDPH